ncbi:LapA family protein [bacterium]|nr:LapA family protein [bacterium]
MQVLKMILFILLVVLVVTFVLQNQWIIQERFSVRYFLYETVPISLSIILLITFSLGAFLCACCYIIKNNKLKRLLNQHKKKIKQMEKELVSLRNLPITEDQKRETPIQAG